MREALCSTSDPAVINRTLRGERGVAQAERRGVKRGGSLWEDDGRITGGGGCC